MIKRDSYDVAVIGGGPTGCVAALACAKRGARVIIFEANSRAASRLAGEWLHPPAVDILRHLGIDLRAQVDHETGLGFAVFPEDGTAPIVLPYAGKGFGAALLHERLVAMLREAVRREGIEFVDDVRATEVDGQRVDYRMTDGGNGSVRAVQIVGATGRTGICRRVLNVPSTAPSSRLAGVVLEHVELPFEGHGHVFCGGLGPILAYRISTEEVRLCLDVPLGFSTKRHGSVSLYEAYASALPDTLRDAFRRAVCERDIQWAAIQVSYRRLFGRPAFALVGDAVGHHHPFTAAGLTVGFQDAVALAHAITFEAYRRRREREGRVPEVLATALYDVFSSPSDEMIGVRRAVYALWRGSEKERRRTMELLSCESVGAAELGAPLFKVLGIAAGSLLAEGVRKLDGKRTIALARSIGSSARGWLARNDASVFERQWTKRRQSGESLGPAQADEHGEQRIFREPREGLALGVRALIALQDQDGSWEGECVWCALLSAEYVLAWHVMGRPIPETRGRRILVHFRRARLPDGLWGLSVVGEPSLFVTTLVYVAARLLGAAADDPLLAPARAFFAREGGVESIPTWGKFWLALVGLYDWAGVHPVLPELWAMPLSSPIHPARYYCHTRLIYVAMATLYAERPEARVSPLIEALRAELYPHGFARVDFAAARNKLRQGDLWERPGRALLRGYDVSRLVNRARSRRARGPLLAELRKLIRWELATTQYTAISPVSGLLDILALWLEDPNDADALRAIECFECWIWEDDEDGMRVSGARSAIWDTAFAVQALRAAEQLSPARDAALRGARFLGSQQIRAAFPGYAENHREDPCGGYPFSRVWHGWPVSDCTAEAILARLETPGDEPSDDDVAIAAQFILRCQGPDGGFGSYEARRVPFSIEWLNPAEMFGDSMAEAGYVECTASCILALAKIGTERPHLLARADLRGVPAAIARGARTIRRQQLASGAWTGAWGIRLIYGTWFGVRGLLSSGAPPTDPAIRKACEWLKARQRTDGAWGEKHAPHEVDYVSQDEGHVVQTAWALLTLCEASDPDFDVLERAAHFLSCTQLGSGQWPEQEPTGLFFRTARLDYVLYRSYFPVWALAAFESRRAARARLTAVYEGPPLDAHLSRVPAGTEWSPDGA